MGTHQHFILHHHLHIPLPLPLNLPGKDGGAVQDGPSGLDVGHRHVGGAGLRKDEASQLGDVCPVELGGIIRHAALVRQAGINEVGGARQNVVQHLAVLLGLQMLWRQKSQTCVQ